jgi:hypothetical protein
MRSESIISQTEAAATVRKRNKPHGGDRNHFRPHGIHRSAHRNEHFRWLETHLWHAKRFHIRSDKEANSVTHSNDGRQLSDADISYFVVISLRASHDSLFDKIAQMVRRNSAIEESLHILWHADFFKPLTFPTSPIGPVDIFWAIQICG